MGYYNYQNGLIFHHIHQSDEWEKHQANARRFILKAIELYKPAKIGVLGSGWLLDVPIAELAEKVKTVFLVDIIHPPDVRNQVLKYSNVKLIEQDVTGGLIEEVWQKAGKFSLYKRPVSAANFEIPEYFPDFDPDLLISINILTQLESLPVEFLKKHTKIKEEEISRFRTGIQQKHINLIRKYKSVLITDFEEVITSRSGDIKTIPTLLTEMPQGRFREEWTWNFDKLGGDLYNSTSQFKIAALIT